MLRIFTALAVLTALPALADIELHNATIGAVRVELTQPNGEVTKRSMSAADPSASRELFLFPPGVKDVQLALFDDSGDSLWKGKARVDDVLVIVPTAKGAAVLVGGIYGGSAGPRSAVFADVTGDKVTFDLVGGNGLGAHRKLSAGATFDLKKAVKLDPREASFSVKGARGTGEALELETSRVVPSTFYVFYKNVRGEVRLLPAGIIVAK